VAGLVHAQGSSAGRWHFTGALYGWLAGVDGTMAAFRSPSIDASTSAKEALERFDGGFMGIGTARRGRFSLGGDVLWARLKQDEGVPLGALASGVTVTSESWMVTGVAGYAVIDRPKATLDLIGGARYWSVDTEIAFRGGALDARTFSDGDDWVDPVVGVSGRADLTEKLFFTGWAVIGGFGAGSDSMWDVMAALGYKFNDRLSTVAGWRVLSVDYEKGAFAYDVEQSGLMLGALYTF